jgi:hypothetical protein
MPDTIKELDEKMYTVKSLLHMHAGLLKGKCFLRKDIPADIVAAIENIYNLATDDTILSLTKQQILDKHEPKFNFVRTDDTSIAITGTTEVRQLEAENC